MSKQQSSGRKVRNNESRSQTRKLASDYSQKDSSLTRRQKQQAAVPMKTKEEIEQETRELNGNARDVLEGYK